MYAVRFATRASYIMADPAIHAASAVAIAGRGLLLEGPPGSGKSTLALALIDRGAQLIGDDAVALENRNGLLWASPPPTIAGKIEIRNLGIIDLPAVSAPVGLILQLSNKAPRYIEQAEEQLLHGARIPLICFDPAIAEAALRAEWAMRLYGLAG